MNEALRLEVVPEKKTVFRPSHTTCISVSPCGITSRHGWRVPTVHPMREIKAIRTTLCVMRHTSLSTPDAIKSVLFLPYLKLV